MFNPRYKLLGVEELPYICDFCLRKEIIVCYVVQDLESTDVLRFGSVCIRKALGVQVRDIKEEINSQVKEIRAKYRHLLNEVENKQVQLADEWRAENNKTVGFCPMDYKNNKALHDQFASLKNQMNVELKRYGHTGFYS